MKYPHGTLIWVKCDDGCWWPAKVRDVDTEVTRFLDQPVEFCVEFYHDPAQLYPILSSDMKSVHFFHADSLSRSTEEGSWFNNPTTQRAVEQALRDVGSSMQAPTRQRHLQGSVESSAGPLGPLERGEEGRCAPLSASKLRSVQLLIAAVGGKTAEQLRETLACSGLVAATGKAKRRRRRREQTQTQEQSQEQTQEQEQRLEGSAAPLPRAERTPLGHHVRVNVEPHPAETRNISESAASPAVARVTDFESEDEQIKSREKTAARFVVPLSIDALNVLRSEVFENPARFVLSPVYRFIELLGAMEVDNHPVVCRLPSPRALREAPPGGFASNRRVLLVPLTTEDYHHTSGWMVPVVVDEKTLAMNLKVNGVVTPTPSNWNLAAGKEANAIKTSPVADITHLVMSQESDLFILEIDFTWIPEDTFLWSGIVACIFVEEVPLSTICGQIVANYVGDANGGVGVTPSYDGSRVCDAVRVTEMSVKVKCPLTALPMVTPVRALRCAHMQCVELHTILVRFTQSNLWNCPLCGVSSRLHEIRVNYRLKEWLDTHRKEIDRVDYIIETPLGNPLRVQWHEAEVKETYCIDD